MKLLLIRHALPRRTRSVGDEFVDPDLDPVGHEQARRLAGYLADEEIHAIYSSPMRRARQTAAPLADALGLEVVVEPDVAECDTLATEYVPQEELLASGDPRWRDGLSASDWPSYYEPLETFHPRIMAGIDRVISRHSGETAAVFCHGGVIARYTSAILDHPWERTGFFFPLYTSITRLTASSKPGGWRMIVSVNEIPHLRGTGLPTGELS
jgi:broad specificity phosphatase PhoE